MTASVDFLQIMILLALGITLVTPVLLVILWIKDWLKKTLW